MEALDELGVIAQHADVRARLVDEVHGKRLRITDRTTLTDIRQHIKNVYREQLVEGIIARGATPAASHGELLARTARMNNADRGSIAEMWYARVELAGRDIRPQVSVVVDRRSRRIDFVDVDVAARESHEVKLGRQLRPHDREQFIDMATAVRDGHPVRVGADTLALNRHKMALLHPDAARAEWSWIQENARRYSEVDFVLFSDGGRRYVLSAATLDAWKINGQSFASFDDWIAAGSPGAS